MDDSNNSLGGDNSPSFLDPVIFSNINRHVIVPFIIGIVDHGCRHVQILLMIIRVLDLDQFPVDFIIGEFEFFS
jgi:hypothetical protein